MPRMTFADIELLARERELYDPEKERLFWASKDEPRDEKYVELGLSLGDAVLCKVAK